MLVERKLKHEIPTLLISSFGNGLTREIDENFTKRLANMNVSQADNDLDLVYIGILAHEAHFF